MDQKKPLPISEHQKRFFLKWALDPQESTCNISSIIKITGKLNKEALKQACEIFIKRNEVVHAQYAEDSAYCYSGDFSIDDFYHELTLSPDQPIELQLRKILDKPFDLTRDVLLQFYLIRNPITDNEFYFVRSFHHIISDGISFIQIDKQVQYAYNCLVEGNTVSLEIDKTFTQTVQVEQTILT